MISYRITDFLEQRSLKACLWHSWFRYLPHHKHHLARGDRPVLFCKYSHQYQQNSTLHYTAAQPTGRLPGICKLVTAPQPCHCELSKGYNDRKTFCMPQGKYFNHL